MPSLFLTARWQDLALITYEVPRALLEPRLPPGLELDELGGRVFASLVAFDFRDCRVRGIRWPGHVNFPEVNLRFYVREKSGGRRGVVFIREFVPSHLIAWTAKTIYNEPYVAVPMTSKVTSEGGSFRVEHELRPPKAAPMQITVTSDEACFTPDESSEEHFFKEHSWGYGIRRGQTLVYEVRHPRWQIHRNAKAQLNIDFAAAYGQEWGVINNATPAHVMLAAGSPIEVWGHQPL